MSKFRGEADLNVTKILTRVVAVVFVLAVILSAGNLFESLDAKEIMVIQSPVAGKLTWYITPGIKWQGFGKVTTYHKRDQFWFSSKEDQGQDTDDSIRIRFNDGGHAMISGSFGWENPLDAEHLTLLHTKYGSQKAIEQQLVRTVAEKSVYMSGPLMSSKESYAERRNELLNIIEDQMAKGVYSTITEETKMDDPITGIKKTVNIVQVVVDQDGRPKRVDASPLEEFGIKTFNLSINEVSYDGEVENQIKQQQQATMQVQIAVAKAKEAEQEAITSQKQGEAKAMTAKWEQEVIKAKAVTEAMQKKEVAITQAEQLLEVAKLDKQSAEQFKLAETLRGEGEAARKKLVMEADGALEKKLAAYTAVNEFYAKALSSYSGNLVPSVVMSSTGSGNSSSVVDLIDMLTVKTAQGLALDMSIKPQPKVLQPQPDNRQPERN